MQSPRRCTFVGPSGVRVRGLLLILQVSVEVFHGGYSCDPSSTGAAPSSEGNLALGSGGKPASEQAVVDPIAGKNCRPLASRIVDFQIISQRGVEISRALSSQPLSLVMYKGKRLHKCRPDLFRPGCLQGAAS